MIRSIFRKSTADLSCKQSVPYSSLRPAGTSNLGKASTCVSIFSIVPGLNVSVYEAHGQFGKESIWTGKNSFSFLFQIIPFPLLHEGGQAAWIMTWGARTHPRRGHYRATRAIYKCSQVFLFHQGWPLFQKYNANGFVWTNLIMACWPDFTYNWYKLWVQVMMKWTMVC